MKTRLFLFVTIVIAFFFLASCGKTKSDSNDTFGGADTLTKSEVATPELSQRDRDLQEVNALKGVDDLYSPSEILTASYDYTLGNFKISGEFYEFKNVAHPLGYVIIKSITFGDKIYVVSKWDKPIYYIASIHKTCLGLQQAGSGAVVYLNDCPQEVQVAFRTIEAMAVAYFKNKEFTEADVAEAGKSMEGRKYGVARQE